MSRSAALRRELGPLSATLFTAGMMLGIGIFAAFGAATAEAGSGILVAMLLGGSVAFATGMSATNLGINDPTEGGAFTWARDSGHETLGFIAGCGYLGKNLVSMSVIALAFATYLAQVVHGVPEHLVAAAVVVVITGLNLFGIALTSRVLIGLLFVDLGLFALYGGASLHAFDAGHLAPLLGTNGLGLFAGAAIFFWTWDGFMRMAIMASEVKRPRRTIPIAVIGGIAIAAVTYLGVGAITLGVLGADAVAMQDTPLLLVAQHAIGDWGVGVVLAAAILAAFAEVLGDLLAASRVVLPMAKAGELPAWLARVDERSRVPRRAVVALGLVSAAADLVFDLRPLIETAGSFMLAWYLITHYAALRLPCAKRLILVAFSLYGIVGCVALVIAMPHAAALAAAGVLTVVTAGRTVARRIA